jgi:hypothetical protein
MKTPLRLFPFAVLACLLALVCRARETVSSVKMSDDAQASIRLTTACSLQPDYGFMPVEVHIENKASSERTWNITFEFGSPNRFLSPEFHRYNRDFSVPANSVKDSVVFVPSPGNVSASRAASGYSSPSIPLQLQLQYTVLGPDVENTVLIANLGDPRQSSPSNYLAVSTGLESAIANMRGQSFRLAMIPNSIGRLQTTRIPPNCTSFFSLSDGSNVEVSNTGTPSVTQPTSPSPANVGVKTTFNIAASGTVTVITPPGVFVTATQTRFSSSHTAGAQAVPPTQRVGRTVLMNYTNSSPKNHFVPPSTTSTFSFSDGTDVIVPSSGSPTLNSPSTKSPGAAAIQMSVDSQDRVILTIPRGVYFRNLTYNRTPGIAASATPTVQHISALTSAIDPTRWPADWRVWSLFGMVALEDDEWHQLDEARKAALLDWVSLGGLLVISPPNGGKTLSRDPHGAGLIVTLEKPLREYSQDDLSTLGLRDTSRHSAPWQKIGALLNKKDMSGFLIEESGSWILLFLFVFGILVGPVTLFKFAPAGRRQRLFVVVPLLSLSATFLLCLIILAKEGFGGVGLRRATVILVPSSNRAVVFQEQVSRTGLLLGSSFSLSEDVLFLRDPNGDDPNCAPQSGAAIYERNAESAKGDWFTSRSRLGHQLRRVVSTRYRVELLPKTIDEAPPSLRSSLPCTLHGLIYVDELGKEWSVSELPPGKTVALSEKIDPVQNARISDSVIRREPGYVYAFGEPTELAPIPSLDSIKWSTASILFVTTPVSVETPSAPSHE